MSHPVRLGPGGHLEVVRRAPPEDPDALRASAAALRSAAGAGAVEIRSMHDDGDSVELVVAFAGHPLDPPVDAPTAISTIAVVAGHLADAHLRGVVHGAITRDHILRDAAGTVRLTGFVAGADDAARDVDALGAVLLELLDDDDRTVDAQAARAVAARCRSVDPAARPTAAAVAASLATMGPRRAVAPRDVVEHVRASRRVPSLITIAATTTFAVIAIAIALLIWLLRPDAARGATTAPSIPPTTSTSLARPTSTSAPRHPARVWPSRTDGAITGDGASWTWDRHDLQTVLADLDCDSVRTPVALDRDGNVWYMPVWPDGATGTATLLTTVPGARRLDVERGHCDQLVVVTADGAVRPAAPGGAQPRSPGGDRPA